MGLVHPLLIVGMVQGRLRPLAALDLRSAEPGWEMVQGTTRSHDPLWATEPLVVGTVDNDTLTPGARSYKPNPVVPE